MQLKHIDKIILLFICEWFIQACHQRTNSNESAEQKTKKPNFSATQIEKFNYLPVFQDEFDSSALNTNNWIPYYLPQWSSREKSRPRYKIENGSLLLTIEEDQQPWCPEFNGDVRVSSLQTGLFSGPLHSKIGQHRFSPDCVVRQEQANKKMYTPRYGYFEIRCRGRIGVNNVMALWMIGYEDLPQRSGEICIVEIKGKNIQNDSTIVGYGIHPFSDPDLKDQFYEDRFAIRPNDFHIYGAEWSPSHVDFYIDNVKTRTISQSPNYPMQFMLNIYELPDSTGKNNTYPALFEIDYVRGYKSKQQ